jgi:hypothetical protein
MNASLKRLLPPLLLLLGLAVARGQTLADALNTTGLTWTTSGTGSASGWSGQTTTSHDGVSAAASGTLSSPGRTSTLQTTVSGPGTLSFWWSNPSLYCSLSLSNGGSLLSSIILYPSWQQQTIYLGSGSQTLKWVYWVSGSQGDFFYRGYVDQVSYTEGATAPLITAHPSGQSQLPGLNATFTVGTGGTPPLHYQWQLGDVDITGATNSSYTVTNVQPGKLGIYTVVVTNGTGSLTSSNAPLEFGQVTGWGASASGAIAVPAGATNVLALTAGLYSSLLLKADGTLSGWGCGVHGETNMPIDLTNAIAISIYAHCLALRADGTVTAWGGSGFGETNVPTGLSNVVAISAGRSPSPHSVALKSDGTVVVWGGYRGETNVPADLTNVVAIAAGAGYDLALKADGTVTTWGSSPPAVPTDLTNVVAIAAGSGHDLALLGNGTVVAWGANGSGQASVPPGLTNVVAIAAGDQHSLALLANGTVVAWGFNYYGQTNVPATLANVITVAGGTYHSLAEVGSGPPVVRVPAVLPALSGNGFSLTVPSQSGQVYALEYKSDLSDANWVPLPLVAGTGADLVLLDPTATNAQRFYRVRRW